MYMRAEATNATQNMCMHAEATNATQINLSNKNINCPNKIFVDVFCQFDRGGNGTRDLLFVCAMSYQLSYEFKSERLE